MPTATLTPESKLGQSDTYPCQHDHPEPPAEPGLAPGATGLDYTVNNCAKRPPVAKYIPDWKRGERELQRICTCGTKWNVWSHKVCGAWWKSPITCNSRWCPRCGRRRADDLVERYYSGISRFRRPALITLTVPNCSGGWLGLHLQVLTEAFKRLRRRKKWNAPRGLYSIEVKWSKKKLYHPHLHIICDWKYLKFSELNKLWKQITEKLFADRGRPHVVSHCPQVDLSDKNGRFHLKDGRIVSREYALREVCKYACGVKRGQANSEFPAYPEHVRWEIASTLSGSRMIQPYGNLKPEKKRKCELHCPDCGTLYQSWAHASHWRREVLTTDEIAEQDYTYHLARRFDDWVREYPDYLDKERKRAP